MTYRLFNENSGKSFPKAAQEHRIEITFKDESFIGSLKGQNTYGTLVGYLNNEFEYSAKGNYTDVFNVSKMDSLAVKLLEDTIQRNIGNYGLLTKKMYTNGESPTLSVSFRCWAGGKENSTNYSGSFVNDKNERKNTETLSNPVLVANALINATMPRVESGSVLMNTNVVNGVVDALSEVGNFVTSLPVAKVGGTFWNNGLTKDILTQAVSTDFIENAKNTLSDLLSKKPPVCSVKIGNIFEKDMMVVASVEVKFSKEYYDVGIPLYGDYNVTLQSLFTGSVNDSMKTMNLDKEKIFGSGLNQKSRTRVTFDDTKIDFVEPDPLKKSNSTFPGATK